MISVNVLNHESNYVPKSSTKESNFITLNGGRKFGESM